MNPLSIFSAIKGVSDSAIKTVENIQENKTERMEGIRGWSAPIIFLLTALPFIWLLWGWFGSIFFKDGGYVTQRAKEIVMAIDPQFFFGVISLLLTGGVGAGVFLSNKKMKMDDESHKREVEVAKTAIEKGELKRATGFDRAYIKTMYAEAGYVNDPDDEGGETYRGVSRKNFPDWRGWKVIDKLKEKKEFPEILNEDKDFQDEVKEFYKKEFWNKVSGNEVSEISDKVAGKLFDMAVNCGIGNASRFFQRALNNCGKTKNVGDIADDGKIGKTSLSALEILCPKYEKAVVIAMGGEQYSYYIKVCEKTPTKWKFFCGWMSRVNEGTGEEIS